MVCGKPRVWGRYVCSDDCLDVRLTEIELEFMDRRTGDRLDGVE